MKDFGKLADDTSVQTVIAALKANNMDAVVVENGEAAKAKVRDLLPEKAEVMTMSSTTLDTLGLTDEINESGKYDSLKAKLNTMNRETQGLEMNRLGAAPDYTIGSVHAITEKGEVLIASNTGSQLPAYAFGANHVIWVVGTQKIVADVDEGMKRMYEHSLKLEAERVKKKYNWPGSAVNKMLMINKEARPGRITVVLVKEVLGF